MSALNRLIAVSLLACAATAAAASPASELPSVEVRYADLDLSKPAGVQVLYRRIRAAAREVCGSLELRSPRQTRRWQDCYDGSLEKAVALADQSTLTALHRQVSTSAT